MRSPLTATLKYLVISGVRFGAITAMLLHSYRVINNYWLQCGTILFYSPLLPLQASSNFCRVKHVSFEVRGVNSFRK